MADRREADAIKSEIRIRNIEEKIKEIDVLMEAVSTNYEDLKRLYEQKVALSKELEEAMEVWLGLNMD